MALSCYTNLDTWHIWIDEAPSVDYTAITYSSSTNGTWASWCNTTASASFTWTNWNAEVVTAVDDTISDIVWGTWSETVTSNGTTWKAVYNSPVETQEQRQARLEQERLRDEAYHRELKEKKAKEAAANAKADELLKSLLTPEQVKMLDELSCFIVTAPSGQVYRIKKGRSMNVEELNKEGKAVAKLCAYPGEYIPNGDTMAAQLLMLELEEDRFRKIANRFPIAN